LLKRLCRKFSFELIEGRRSGSDARGRARERHQGAQRHGRPWPSGAPAPGHMLVCGVALQLSAWRRPAGGVWGAARPRASAALGGGKPVPRWTKHCLAARVPWGAVGAGRRRLGTGQGRGGRARAVEPQGQPLDVRRPKARAGGVTRPPQGASPSWGAEAPPPRGERGPCRRPPARDGGARPRARPLHHPRAPSSCRPRPSSRAAADTAHAGGTACEAAAVTLGGIACLPRSKPRQLGGEEGEAGLTAAAPFDALAASSPHRPGQRPLHDLLSKICDTTPQDSSSAFHCRKTSSLRRPKTYAKTTPVW
jgi:hypothetical protein